MRNNAHQNYLENEVLTADPLKLVVLLYQGALDSIAVARWQAGGNIAIRSKSIRKALAIVWELNRSLDMNCGSDVSIQLSKLYMYVRGKLVEANRSFADAPLAEAEKLMSTLLEAWRQCESIEAPVSLSGATQEPYASREYESTEYANAEYANADYKVEYAGVDYAY
jgi:flagellar protein FliS